MILLLGLWLGAALYEGLLYWNIRSVAPARRGLRTIVIGAALLLTTGAAIALILANWQLGLLPLVLTPYRIINLVRLYVRRLPGRQLRTISVRAHISLVAVQVLGVVLVASGQHFHLGRVLLAILAALQLLVAFTLLRITLHTWRHARPQNDAQPLADKDLPSLSVLVPARNETEDLENCLRSLIASDYPKLEIVVLDDNSTNRRTPEIIRGFAHDGVRFVQGAVPDEKNWLAKNQAYARLAHEASGELLLFCGVDVLFEPQSLRLLVEGMLAKQKDMVSVLPLRAASVRATASLLQPMRYYWELCLPRRFFKRPPVLSTCWLVRAALLERAGGFGAVSRSVTPEAHFARQAVVTDAYSFMRSNADLGIYSAKPVTEQYATSVRTRYPQLHRRLELVAIAVLLELVFFVGPVIGLCAVGFTPEPMAYAAVWIAALACLLVTYYLVAVDTKLNNPLIAWLLMPLAFLSDVLLVHISMYKYEFSQVIWKDRDVAVPVMQVLPHLPKP